jgi:hypothetical protein
MAAPPRSHRSAGLATTALLVAASVLVGGFGCGGTVPAPRSGGGADAPRGNPLGPSYVLIPLPTEDDALLGRVIPDVPEPGETLEAVSRPNPCGDKLEPPKETSLASTFEYAEELGADQSAGAILGSFGFSADASQATHFLYTLRTTRRLAVSDTNDYEACCKEKACGYGFVSALIYGDGEYATGAEATGSVSGGVPLVASASGGVQVKTLDKKKVKGWIAAVVTVTDRTKGKTLGALATESAVRATAEMLDADVRAMLELERVTTELSGDAKDSGDWTFVQGRQPLTEPEFARNFKKVTGSSELDHLDYRRNLGSTITYGSLFGASSLCVLGTVIAAQDDAGGWYLMTVACGVAAIPFGVSFTIKLLDPDGKPTDHDLGEAEARRYTIRYNQLVLKKVLREQPVAPEARSNVPHVRFGVGAAALSAEGSF